MQCSITLSCPTGYILRWQYVHPVQLWVVAHWQGVHTIILEGYHTLLRCYTLRNVPERFRISQVIPPWQCIHRVQHWVVAHWQGVHPKILAGNTKFKVGHPAKMLHVEQCSRTFPVSQGVRNHTLAGCLSPWQGTQSGHV